MDIAEKVAYIKGLAEGLELSDESKEGRVIFEMLAVLGDVSDALSSLVSGMDTLYDHVIQLSEDVDHLYAHDCEDTFLPDEDLEEYEGDVYEVICPYCQEEILLLEECLDEGAVICPTCESLLEFDFSGEIEDGLLGEESLESFT